MTDDSGATSWDDMLADFAFTPDEQADIDQRAEQLHADVEACSAAIDQACTDLDPEQAASFDAQHEQTRRALVSSPFEPSPKTVQLTYERADAHEG